MIGIVYVCSHAKTGSWECIRTHELCLYTLSWVAAFEQFRKDGIETIQAPRAPYCACEHYPKSEEKEDNNV